MLYFMKLCFIFLLHHLTLLLLLHHVLCLTLLNFYYPYLLCYLYLNHILYLSHLPYLHFSSHDSLTYPSSTSELHSASVPIVLLEDTLQAPPYVSTSIIITRDRDGISRRKPTDFLSHFSTKISYYLYFDAFLEPKTYKTACKDPKWVQAMLEKISALVANGTWELVPFNHFYNVLGCKWIYKVKLLSDGSVKTLKARLVAEC